MCCVITNLEISNYNLYADKCIVKMLTMQFQGFRHLA